MKTLPLGKTGENVSALCLGIMYFGTRQDEAQSFRLLDRYLEAGGSFIDTANIYAHWVDGFRGGESEAVLGKWLRARHARSRVFIATKVGFDYQDVPRSLHAAHIQKECEKSLRRLGTEAIDLFYAHVDDRLTPLEETLEAFDRLVKAGRVRYVGASNFRAWRLEQARALSAAHGWAQYCCIQQRYTYLRPRPGASFDPQLSANDDLLDYVRSTGLTLLAYSALLSGAYTRRDRLIPEQYLGTDTAARLAELHAVAGELGATLNQVINAWMLHHDPPVLPLIAASTSPQLDELLGSLDLKLSADQLARLDQATG